MEFFEANSTEDYQLAGQLFQEYADQIGVDLEFQNFKEELNKLQLQYTRPQGVLFLVKDQNGTPLGCFAIRVLEGHVCELKRMYLRKEGRGKGVGKQMLNCAIETARQLGYKKMRLDTLPTMNRAIALYMQAGFYEIDSYRT